ncbi:polysaccharide biosynthesis tyrosine autokinase [Croceicoccus sp. F390]|uniref:non-specific protein-tyrosine kinase n=1 Tax=Croceicoccus esteveae TaxID=3075597 RepID=A0ABU2ZHF9_9SPHN|nr:polysaccharide biosynthesis tyrosine autokinase [Croceicoccus sp. F390]MDT0575734.1 polysaccharide biosynthesis tyrosine autokinase [Croceicoccus sp. F390]
MPEPVGMSGPGRAGKQMAGARGRAGGPHAAPIAAAERSYDFSADESSVGQALRSARAKIRRHRVPIAIVVALALLVALVATLLATPLYEAEASVQIRQAADNVLGEDLDSDRALRASSLDAERFLNSQLEILRSRGLAERVVRKLDLAADPGFAQEMGMAAPSLAPGMMAEATATAIVQERTTAILSRDTDIARITVASADRALAAKIANAFAEELIAANLQRDFDSAAYARTFIAGQLEDARADLEKSERALNDYARQARLIRLDDAGAAEGTVRNTSVTVGNLAMLNEAATAAGAERAAAEARWQAERAQPLLSSQAVLSNPTVQALMTRRSQLDAELQAQRLRYVDEHPAIRELQRQLEVTQAQLQQTATQIRNATRTQYLAAQLAEDRLREQVGNQEQATLAEQDRTVRYNTLAREADTNRALYDGLLQRSRQLNAAAGIAASNIAIIDRARPPSLPSSPNLLHNLLVGLAAGLLLAAVLVFVREHLDEIIRIPEDVEAKSGLPLLGVIPAASGDLVQELADPCSFVGEAYASLRGLVLHASPLGLPQILMITSARPAEGKTTTSYALAAGLARMGRHVILVDADMRRPSAHQIAGTGNETGLSSVLTDLATLEEVIRPLDVAGLSILTAGPTLSNAGELLATPRFAALLEQLAGTFDAVIVDSPPVLGLADAPAIAALADAVILVVEADVARRRTVRNALARLRQVQAVVLGATLTKFDADAAAHSNSAYGNLDYYRYPAYGGEPDALNAARLGSRWELPWTRSRGERRRA